MKWNFGFDGQPWKDVFGNLFQDIYDEEGKWIFALPFDVAKIVVEKHNKSIDKLKEE